MSSLLLSVLVVLALSALGAFGPVLRRWSLRAGEVVVAHSPCVLRRAWQRRAAARALTPPTRLQREESVERVLSLAELRRGG
jgi:hypothetical protein